MYTEIKKCRICGNAKFLEILSLGNQPQAGIFPKPGEVVEEGPLDLVKCDESVAGACGLVQLRHSFAPDELYGQNYGYRSGLNSSMVKHLESKSKYARTLVGLKPADVVLDIGSNDGTYLKSYTPDEGLRLIGIDPTIAKFGSYYREGIEKYPEFFTKETVQRILGSVHAKLITSISMFYDLESPLDFVSTISSTLDEDGVWIFEQSYLPLMLERNSYDTVCHEHLEYYHLKPIMWMLERSGLKIIDLELNDINGGSISITAALKRSKKFASYSSELLQDLLKKEAAMQLEKETPYSAFRERVSQQRIDLIGRLKELKRNGKRVFGYGASTKGNVILNYCELSAGLIECIAEVNEDKVGKVTPGSRIPIISERDARSKKPDVFFVLPWHFKKFILEKEQDFLKSGGQLLFPLPKVEGVEA